MSSDFTNNNNFTWRITSNTGDNFFFSEIPITNNSIKTPDYNWMPYVYVEYEPIWHKKFARIKLQMEHMWD